MTIETYKEKVQHIIDNNSTDVAKNLLEQLEDEFLEENYKFVIGQRIIDNDDIIIEIISKTKTTSINNVPIYIYCGHIINKNGTYKVSNGYRKIKAVSSHRVKLYVS